MSSLVQADVIQAVQNHFPQCVTLEHLFKWVHRALRADPRTGAHLKNALVATSSCPDEINRDLDLQLSSEFGQDFGRPFTMGGLAGFPFVGKTGFQAFLAHLPKDGLLVIFCSSHIGVNHFTQEAGKIRRVGMDRDTTACGAAVGAFQFCSQHADELKKIEERDQTVYPGFGDSLDEQQNWVIQFVAKNFHRIKEHKNPQVELANVVGEKIFEDVRGIIPADCPTPVIVVSGVQINVEGDDVGDDYFLLHQFKGWVGGEEIDFSEKFWEQGRAHKKYYESLFANV